VAQNQSKDDPEAYCAAIKREVEGKSMFGFLKSALKAVEDRLKQHPHGDHVCVCPECGTKQTVEAGDKCKELTCSKCGARMRAEETGEFRKDFSIFKDAAGNLRWIGITSNHFRDHDNPPEIIESKAHEDFVAHLDQTKEYPPLLLWHTPGAELGKTDFTEFSHGFLVTSGVINKGMESVVEALKNTDLGMSHGFRFKYSEPEKRIIGYYRTFENTVLPREYAANPWTTVEMITKEAGMRPEKKAFLEKALGKERTDAIMGSLETLQKELVGAGIEYKEADSFDACMAANSDREDAESYCRGKFPEKDKPAEIVEKAEPDLDAVAQKAITGIMESDGMKSVMAAVEAMKALTPRLDALEASLKEIKAATEQNAKDIKKSQDELVAAAFKPRSTAGVKASQSDKTLVTEADDKLKSAKPPFDPWFAGSLAK
jgi:transcription elongation factor Elf1